MKILRPATKEEIAAIESGAELGGPPASRGKSAGKDKKGKKPKTPSGDEPARPTVTLGPLREDGVQMIEEFIAEPVFEPIPETAGSQVLSCGAVADVPRYECEVQNCVFRPTAMYQARTFTFTVTNPADMSLPYSFRFVDLNPVGTARQASARSTMRPKTAASGPGMAPVPCPFSITPSDGTITAQSSQTFTLRFAPEEVEDFVYCLEGLMHTLPQDAKDMKITVRGRSLRPVCHFELTENTDYMNRRSQYMKNEKGQMSPIEATSVRVVELSSRGTRVRNTKRFHVVDRKSVV